MRKRYVTVIFETNGHPYTYASYDSSLHTGDLAVVKTAGGKKTVLIVKVSLYGRADAWILRKANTAERKQFLKKEPELKKQVRDEQNWIDDLEMFSAMWEE
ncbi:MAG: hypothetical protein IKE21_10060 [Erysipelotrichaceae bacterium]|nr:hypothetical protein [Erysipelotrichaceae bacterium]